MEHPVTATLQGLGEGLIHLVDLMAFEGWLEYKPTGKLQYDADTRNIWYEVKDITDGYICWVSPTATDRMAHGERLAAAESLDEALGQ